MSPNTLYCVGSLERWGTRYKLQVPTDSTPLPVTELELDAVNTIERLQRWVGGNGPAMVIAGLKRAHRRCDRIEWLAKFDRAENAIDHVLGISE